MARALPQRQRLTRQEAVVPLVGLATGVRVLHAVGAPVHGGVAAGPPPRRSGVAGVPRHRRAPAGAAPARVRVPVDAYAARLDRRIEPDDPAVALRFALATDAITLMGPVSLGAHGPRRERRRPVG